MRNISALKAAVFFVLAAGLPAPGRAANLLEEGKAFVEKYVEEAMPLFDPHEVDSQPKQKTDEFYDKIRRERAEFLKKEKERKDKFFKKIRKKDLRSEKAQREIAEFQSETIERMMEFNEKQQKKIQKHIDKQRRG